MIRLFRELKLNMGFLSPLAFDLASINRLNIKVDGALVTLQGTVENIQSFKNESANKFPIVLDSFITPWPAITVSQVNFWLKAQGFNDEFKAVGNHRVWIQYKKGRNRGKVVPIFSGEQMVSLNWVDLPFMSLKKAHNLVDTIDKVLWNELNAPHITGLIEASVIPFYKEMLYQMVVI